LSELSVNPESFPIGNEEELSSLVSLPPPKAAGGHRISRVVVLHNDKLETFFDAQKEVGNFFDNDSFWSGSITWY
jgi:hypothetical protein